MPRMIWKMSEKQQAVHDGNQLRMYLLRYKTRLEKKLDSEEHLQPSVVYGLIQELEAVKLLLNNIPIR
jgi:hypothetical protein